MNNWALSAWHLPACCAKRWLYNRYRPPGRKRFTEGSTFLTGIAKDAVVRAQMLLWREEGDGSDADWQRGMGFPGP